MIYVTLYLENQIFCVEVGTVELRTAYVRKERGSAPDVLVGLRRTGYAELAMGGHVY